MENNQNTSQNGGERTFTQEEVNRIVGERLAKEKTKSDAAFAEREHQFAEREQQLANREAMLDLKDQLKEMGLPEELLPVLNVQDKAALSTALESLKTYIERQTSQKGMKVMENRLPEASHTDNEGAAAKLRRAMGLPG